MGFYTSQTGRFAAARPGLSGAVNSIRRSSRKYLKERRFVQNAAPMRRVLSPRVDAL